jgi:riboflavin biosynthesis pyrimidine reductase
VRVPTADWRARFEALVARKTAEAVAAVIDPFASELDRPEPTHVAIGNAWTRRLFDGFFYLSRAPSADAPAASLVFVRSRDGDTVAKNPSTLGGGEADKHLVYEGLSRVAADAVMSGAATIRGSDLVLTVWHPELVALRAGLGLPRHPMQVVATVHGMALGETLMFNVPELRVTIVTVDRGAKTMAADLAERPWIAPIVLRDPEHLPAAFRQLRQSGVETLSCIGGRTIAGQLIDAGLIQDLYLTTSAIAGGEPNSPFYAKSLEARLVVRKHGTGADAGVVFEHLVIGTRSSAPA